jgi:competence protein ComGC
MVVIKKVYSKIENFGVEAKSQRGFEKGDMLVLIMVESITIVLAIPTF